MEGSLHAKTQLDSSSRFDTVPACDGRTDRRTHDDREISLLYFFPRLPLPNASPSRFYGRIDSDGSRANWVSRYTYYAWTGVVCCTIPAWSMSAARFI